MGFLKFFRLGHFRNQKIGNMLNERHIFVSFVLRMLADERAGINWADFKPVLNLSARWPHFNAFQRAPSAEP